MAADPRSLETSLDTVAALVRSRAGDANVGLRFEGRVWSWAEVVAEMQVRGAWLADLVRDDPPHVGVLLENVPEHLFLIGGAALAGRVVVGINPTRRGAELARDIRHTDCQAIVTDAGHVDLLEGLDLGPAGDRVVITDLHEHDAELVRLRAGGAAVAARPAPDDLLMLIFTSGSSGAPKAVRMTQGRAARAATHMGFRSDDVLYCAMPLFHGNALNSMVFPALRSGASLVFRSRFSASRFIHDVRDHGCTFTSTVGRGLAYVLGTPARADDRDHHLKYVLAPESSAADMKAFERRFGPPVFGGYGSSENAVVLTPSPGQPPDALGRPAPGLEVAVIDPSTGEECPRARFDDDGKLLNAAEAIGELVGLNALDRFEGYYNNEEATLERTRSGWYWSGDLAYRDEDGLFYFAGRNADWIRVDGENFAAAPVERIIQRYPGVAGVAVFGVPDDRTADDQVMAVVELDGTAELDPTDFDAFLAAQRDLGTKWAPRYLRVVPSLPVTATNKIDKAPLREARWISTGDDPLFWRPDRREPLQPLTDDDRAEILRRFEANGRAEVLRR